MWLSQIFLTILKTGQLFTETAEVKASNFQLLSSWGFCRKLSSELPGKRGSGGGPVYNTGQREPKPRSPHHFSSPTQKLPVSPKSCRFHPKVAVNQKLRYSTKTCHVHPNVAGVNRKMPVSPKSCQFYTKVPVFLRKKFRLHPQPKVTGFTLKLTSSTKSWFHLKVPGVT